MALTTVSDFKLYAGITGGDDDALYAQLLTRAQSTIENFCRRKFDSATYRERYDGGNTNVIVLDQYPVTDVDFVARGTQVALIITNTSSDAYRAGVSISETTMSLTVYGGTNAGTDTLTLSSYATITLLIAAVAALSKGWSAIAQSSAFATYDPTELLPAGKLECLDNFADLEVPEEPETDYTVMEDEGMVLLAVSQGARFVPEFADPAIKYERSAKQNLIVKYTAGYSSATMPGALSQICIDAMKSMNDTRTKSTGLKAEKLGDYAYTNKDNSGTGGALPKDIRVELAPFVKGVGDAW